MAFHGHYQPRIKANITKKSLGYQETQRNLFKQFISKCDPAINYWNQHQLNKLLYDEFKHSTLYEKSRYLEVYFSTMGRFAQSIRSLHYINMAGHDLKGDFDFAYHQLDRKHLLSEKSLSTHAKNLLAAVNRDENDWCYEYYKSHNGKWPPSRPNGPIAFYIGYGVEGQDISAVLTAAKKFNNKYYIKDEDKYKRGNFNKGFRAQDFAVVHSKMYKKYQTEIKWHNPRYFLGILILSFVLLIGKRNPPEWWCMQHGRDVVRNGDKSMNGRHFVIKQPLGIKNNTITEKDTTKQNKEITVTPTVGNGVSTYEFMDTYDYYRPTKVKDNAYWCLPRPEFKKAEEVEEGESGAFYSDTRLGIKGFARCVKLVINSFGFNWNGNLNDFKYEGTELMLIAGFSDAEISNRTGHTSNAINIYKDKVYKHMSMMVTQNDLYKTVNRISSSESEKKSSETFIISETTNNSLNFNKMPVFANVDFQKVALPELPQELQMPIVTDIVPLNMPILESEPLSKVKIKTICQSAIKLPRKIKPDPIDISDDDVIITKVVYKQPSVDSNSIITKQMIKKTLTEFLLGLIRE
eukprot:173536_1